MYYAYIFVKPYLLLHVSSFTYFIVALGDFSTDLIFNEQKAGIASSRKVGLKLQ